MNHQRSLMLQVSQQARELGLDCIMITSPFNRMVINGFGSSAGALLITAKDACCFFVDSRYAETAAEPCRANDYELIITPGLMVPSFIAPMKQWLEAHGVSRLGFEDKFVTVEAYNHYAKLGCEMVPTGDLADNLRVCKSPEDRANMQAAQDITDAAFLEMLNFIKPGMTEMELATHLDVTLLQLGADTLSFASNCQSGPNGTRPHGRPTARKLEKGDSLVMDFGAVKRGMNCDMTRTISIGPATDLFKRAYQVTWEAQRNALDRIKPGMTCHEADALARDVIDATEFKGQFIHLLGHGVGLRCSELPIVDQGNHAVLKEGMMFSVEPGIYIPGVLGIRIEDVVYLDKDCAKVFSKADKSLIEL